MIKYDHSNYWFIPTYAYVLHMYKYWCTLMLAYICIACPFLLCLHVYAFRGIYIVYFGVNQCLYFKCIIVYLYICMQVYAGIYTVGVHTYTGVHLGLHCAYWYYLYLCMQNHAVLGH